MIFDCGCRLAAPSVCSFVHRCTSLPSSFWCWCLCSWPCPDLLPVRPCIASTSACFGSLSSLLRMLLPFQSRPPWNNTCYTTQFQECPRTPAWTALALALSICPMRTILSCLLWTLSPYRGSQWINQLYLYFNSDFREALPLPCTASSTESHDNAKYRLSVSIWMNS